MPMLELSTTSLGGKEVDDDAELDCTGGGMA